MRGYDTLGKKPVKVQEPTLEDKLVFRTVYHSQVTGAYFISYEKMFRRVFYTAKEGWILPSRGDFLYGR